MKNKKKILMTACVLSTLLLFACELGLEGTKIEYSNSSGTFSPEDAWIETCIIQDGFMEYSKTSGEAVELLSFEKAITEDEAVALKIKIQSLQSTDDDKKLVDSIIGGGVTTLTIDNVITFLNDSQNEFSAPVAEVHIFIQELIEKYSF